MDKLPAHRGQCRTPRLPQGTSSEMRRQVAIINSMTPGERRYPEIIDGSRRRRIAAGSGTQVQDVNRLLKQFMQMQKMMKRMGKGGMQKMLRGLKKAARRAGPFTRPPPVRHCLQIIGQVIELKCALARPYTSTAGNHLQRTGGSSIRHASRSRRGAPVPRAT
ncbi:MAG: hypothetical protein MZV65_18125 [Chromatiales bacterium]|nr:hypothetical protein [Chromatiales bacterium]